MTIAQLAPAAAVTVGIAIGIYGALKLSKERTTADITALFLKSISGGVFAYGLLASSTQSSAQVAVISLCGAWIAQFGLQDLTKGQKARGLCKMLLSMSTVAIAVYYAYGNYAYNNYGYCSLADYAYNSLSDKPEMLCGDPFLLEHQMEIEKMYRTHAAIGDWEKLGESLWKDVFEHPGFPEKVIKMSRYDRYEMGWEYLVGEDANVQHAKEIALLLDGIIIPETQLCFTSMGPIIVQQKLNLMPGRDLQYDIGETMDRFWTFQKLTGLCDLAPIWNQNAGFITNAFPPKIGVIDFDCRYYGDQYLEFVHLCEQIAAGYRERGISENDSL